MLSHAAGTLLWKEGNSVPPMGDSEEHPAPAPGQFGVPMRTLWPSGHIPE